MGVTGDGDPGPSSAGRPTRPVNTPHHQAGLASLLDAGKGAAQAGEPCPPALLASTSTAALLAAGAATSRHRTADVGELNLALQHVLHAADPARALASGDVVLDGAVAAHVGGVADSLLAAALAASAGGERAARRAGLILPESPLEAALRYRAEATDATARAGGGGGSGGGGAGAPPPASAVWPASPLAGAASAAAPPAGASPRPDHLPPRRAWGGGGPAVATPTSSTTAPPCPPGGAPHQESAAGAAGAAPPAPPPPPPAPFPLDRQTAVGDVRFAGDAASPPAGGASTAHSTGTGPSPSLPAVESWSNFGSVRARAGVRGGRWAFDVVLGSAGIAQLGWATARAATRFTNEEGVGDAPDSYAFDGRRVRKWAGSAAAYGEAWAPGDTVTCCLDASRASSSGGGVISFYRNGRPLGSAFTGVRTVDGSGGAPPPHAATAPNTPGPLDYHPALSLSYGERVEVSLGGAAPLCAAALAAGYEPIEAPPAGREAAAWLIGCLARLAEVGCAAGGGGGARGGEEGEAEAEGGGATPARPPAPPPPSRAPTPPPPDAHSAFVLGTTGAPAERAARLLSPNGPAAAAVTAAVGGRLAGLLRGGPGGVAGPATAFFAADAVLPALVRLHRSAAAAGGWGRGRPPAPPSPARAFARLLVAGLAPDPAARAALLLALLAAMARAARTAAVAASPSDEAALAGAGAAVAASRASALAAGLCDVLGGCAFPPAAAAPPPPLAPPPRGAEVVALAADLLDEPAIASAWAGSPGWHPALEALLTVRPPTPADLAALVPAGWWPGAGAPSRAGGSRGGGGPAGSTAAPHLACAAAHAAQAGALAAAVAGLEAAHAGLLAALARMPTPGALAEAALAALAALTPPPPRESDDGGEGGGGGGGRRAPTPPPPPDGEPAAPPGTASLSHHAHSGALPSLAGLGGRHHGTRLGAFVAHLLRRNRAALRTLPPPGLSDPSALVSAFWGLLALAAPALRRQAAQAGDAGERAGPDPLSWFPAGALFLQGVGGGSGGPERYAGLARLGGSLEHLAASGPGPAMPAARASVVRVPPVAPPSRAAVAAAEAAATAAAARRAAAAEAIAAATRSARAAGGVATFDLVASAVTDAVAATGPAGLAGPHRAAAVAVPQAMEEEGEEEGEEGVEAFGTPAASSSSGGGGEPSARRRRGPDGGALSASSSEAWASAGSWSDGGGNGGSGRSGSGSSPSPAPSSLAPPSGAATPAARSPSPGTGGAAPPRPTPAAAGSVSAMEVDRASPSTFSLLPPRPADPAASAAPRFGHLPPGRSPTPSAAFTPSATPAQAAAPLSDPAAAAEAIDWALLLYHIAGAAAFKEAGYHQQSIGGAAVQAAAAAAAAAGLRSSADALAGGRMAAPTTSDGVRGRGPVDDAALAAADAAADAAAEAADRAEAGAAALRAGLVAASRVAAWHDARLFAGPKIGGAAALCAYAARVLTVLAPDRPLFAHVPEFWLEALLDAFHSVRSARARAARAAAAAAAASSSAAAAAAAAAGLPSTSPRSRPLPPHPPPPPLLTAAPLGPLAVPRPPGAPPLDPATAAAATDAAAAAAAADHRAWSRAVQDVITAVSGRLADPLIAGPDARELMVQSLGVLAQSSRGAAALDRNLEARAHAVPSLLILFQGRAWVPACTLLAAVAAPAGLAPSPGRYRGRPGGALAAALAAALADPATVGPALNRAFAMLSWALTEAAASRGDADASPPDSALRRRRAATLELAAALARLVEYTALTSPGAFLGGLPATTSATTPLPPPTPDAAAVAALNLARALEAATFVLGPAAAARLTGGGGSSADAPDADLIAPVAGLLATLWHWERAALESAAGGTRPDSALDSSGGAGPPRRPTMLLQAGAAAAARRARPLPPTLAARSSIIPALAGPGSGVPRALVALHVARWEPLLAPLAPAAAAAARADPRLHDLADLARALHGHQQAASAAAAASAATHSGPSRPTSAAAAGGRVLSAVAAAACAAADAGEEAGAPPTFLDPLTCALMSDPVILASSRQRVDRSTAARLMLGPAPADPFSRAPLKTEDLEPDAELKAKIEAWRRGQADGAGSRMEE